MVRIGARTVSGLHFHQDGRQGSSRLRRRLLTVLAVALLCVGCAQGFPDAIDPSAPHVIPPVGFGAASVATTIPTDVLTPGIEGSVLFVRLKTNAGDTILDRAFAWPTDQQAVPPGAYRLTAYWRVCDANCGNLDEGELTFCQENVDLKAGSRVLISVVTANAKPGWRCSVGPQS